MKYQNPNSVTAKEIMVSQTVYEMMVIEVNDHQLQSTELRYKIQDAAKKVLRQGSFIGCRIQLRLNALLEGEYTVVLEQEAAPLLVTNFKKCAERNPMQNSYPFYQLNGIAV